jgi:hypothetical protein
MPAGLGQINPETRYRVMDLPGQPEYRWNGSNWAVVPSFVNKGRTLGMLGDSITKKNFNNATVCGWGSDGYMAAANMMMGWPFEIIDVQATPGYTIEQIATDHLPAIIAAAPEYCFVLGGSNNLFAGQDGATIYGLLRDRLWKPLLAAGIKVIAGTIMPRTDATGASLKALVDANDYIRVAGQLNPDVVVVDMYSAFVDYDKAVPRTGFADDSIHQNTTGSGRLALEIYSTLTAAIPRLSKSRGGYTNGDPLTISANPLAYGANASGTKKWAVSGGAAGTGPHNWNGTQAATCAVTFTGGVARLDSLAGNALQAAATFGANGDSFTIKPNNDIYLAWGWAAATEAGLGELRRPTAPNGFLYKSLTSGANTGGAEPAWPTQIGTTVVDGGVTWLCCPDVVAGDKMILEVDFAVTAQAGQIGFRTQCEFYDAGWVGKNPSALLNGVLYPSADNRAYGITPPLFDKLFDTTLPQNKIMTVRSPVIVNPAGVAHLSPGLRVFGTAGSTCTLLIHRMELRHLQ